MLTFLVTLASFFGASVSAEAKADAGAICQEGFESFSRSVYRKIRRDCAGCHGGVGGPTKAPPFAVPDPAKSYAVVMGFVDFRDLGVSTIRVRAGNDHCGNDNCNQESGADMADRLKSWWEGGENRCERVGRVMTAEQSLPSPLPGNGPEFTTMSWDLGSLRAELSGARLTMDVQRFSEGGPQGAAALRFSKPRVLTAAVPARVSGIRVLLNRTPDPVANAYLDVDSRVGAAASPVLSSRDLIVVQRGEQPGVSPLVSVSFEGLEATSEPRCRAVAEFQARVLPGFTAQQCNGCHGGGGAVGVEPANRLFSMDLGADDLCAASLQRAQGSQIDQFPLFTYPLRGMHGHPVVASPDSSLLFREWRTWIQEERR